MIAPTGIVGRVVGQPAAHAARVQLIIDRHAAAGAISERSRAGGMVVGQDEPGKPPLRMELVSNLADLKVGDVIVTSGADGIYPKGFAIGRVEIGRAGTGLVPGGDGPAGGGLSQPRGSARRAGAGAAGDRRRATAPGGAAAPR